MTSDAPTPRVQGILETALYVDDLDRSRTFYQSLFGFRVVVGGNRLCALSVNARQMLLLFKRGESRKPTTNSLGGYIPPSDATGEQHLAFLIGESSYDDWKRRLTQEGVTIESEVEWEEGGRSIYFRDPDRHSIELGTARIWPGVEPVEPPS